MKAHFLAPFLAAIWVAGCAHNDQANNNSIGSMPYSRRTYLAGRAAAKRDIQHGVLAVESAGLMADWSGEYVRILKQRYGIEDRTVAGCMVDDEILGHLRGYNEVSRAEITRRYGPDVFDRTAAEARVLYKKKHPHRPSD